MKNEGAYIKEWIDYHLGIGINHIYVYDNDSTDNTIDIISRYIKAGAITYTKISGRGMQLNAYNEAIKKFKDESKYFAVIDADEFLVPLSSESIYEIIDGLMTLNPKAGGVAVNWRMFGSSGHIAKPKGGVLENFLYRAKDNGKGNICIKTIINPRRVYKFSHVHYPIYGVGYYSISEKGKIVTGWKNSDTDLKMLCINHYFTKSKEEWIKRRSMGKADFKDETSNRTIQEFYEHDNNDVYDDRAWKLYQEIIKNNPS